MELTLAWLAVALHFALATMSATQALLYKRDTRAALGWIAVSFAYPLLGPILYSLFGINRLRTRAPAQGQTLATAGNRLRGARVGGEGRAVPPPSGAGRAPRPRGIGAIVERGNASRAGRRQPGGAAVQRQGCLCGDAARDPRSAPVGGDGDLHFRKQPQRPRIRRRGVEVRVLLDGFGEWYSLPRAGSLLKREGVNVARFIPPRILPPLPHVNLRNHRKLLPFSLQISNVFLIKPVGGFNNHLLKRINQRAENPTEQSSRILCFQSRLKIGAGPFRPERRSGASRFIEWFGSNGLFEIANKASKTAIICPNSGK